MSEVSTSPSIVHDHGDAQNVNLPYPVSSPDIDDPSDLPRITPRWRTIKWTPYRLFFPFSAILFGVSKFVLTVADYNVGSGVLELWFGVVLALVFWAGGLMEPAAPQVGLWGWFFHGNYGRAVRKVVWSISALCIVMLAPFWLVVKIASVVISACSRSPIPFSDTWHQLEELEHGHGHREHRESLSRSQTAADYLHNQTDSLRQRRLDPSQSRVEPRPQALNVGTSTSVAIHLIPSTAPIIRPLRLKPLYLPPDDMDPTDLVPSLKGGQCKSVRSKRVPGGHRAFYVGRRVGAHLH